MTPAPGAAEPRVAALTALALVAFAANSVICRLALTDSSIDAASFTAVRVGAGALALAPWLFLRRRSAARPDPRAALALFVYAIGFSFAYLSLEAGTGALLAFGTVQLTMLLTGVVRGERPGPAQLVGIVVALAGVAWLVSPGVSAPDLVGALLMVTAGIGWGVYSLLGRGAADPVHATATNFTLAAPLALVALLPFRSELALDARGAGLAVLSGAVTSGLGYVVWYAALRGHTRTSAAVVQLAVPLVAAVGGVLFLGEHVTVRLAGSATLTLGGIALALRARPGGARPGEAAPSRGRSPR